MSTLFSKLGPIGTEGRTDRNFFPSCCGAGTAADCDKTTNMISSQLELHRLNTGRQVRVCVATRLLKQYLFR